jgi:hypothetical protein
MKKLIICLTGFLSLIVIFIIPCYAGECPGDINCDGDVDGSDLAVFAADFGRTDCDSSGLYYTKAEVDSMVEALQIQMNELIARIEYLYPDSQTWVTARCEIMSRACCG